MILMLIGCTQYSDETASLLARQLLDGATVDMTIAVVSAPSVFVALKNILVASLRFALMPRIPLNEGTRESYC
jgi:hypothetical protein